MSYTTFLNVLFICCLGTATGLIEDSKDGFERSLMAQRLGCNEKKENDFITEYKRLPVHRYVAEYKRVPEYRYSFGIGKRWYDDSEIKRNIPYSFGVGKRFLEKNRPLKLLTVLSPNNGKYDTLVGNSELDETGMKRGAPSRSYDFGIGKRSNLFSNTAETQQKIQKEDNLDNGLPVNTRGQDHLDIYNANTLNSNDDQIWPQY